MIRGLNDFKFEREHDRFIVNLLFETPAVSKTTKYAPLTKDQAKNLILLDAETTVLDTDGQWVGF